MAMMAGPDSADPKQVLNDLQQVQRIAARLGIQLGQIGASGQTVGQRLGRTTDDHQAYHSGGGSGYQNLAMGAIVGSSIARRFGDNQSFIANQLRGIRPVGGTLNSSLKETLDNATEIKSLRSFGRFSEMKDLGRRAVLLRTHRGETYIRKDFSAESLASSGKYEMYRWRGVKEGNTTEIGSFSGARRLSGPSLSYRVGYRAGHMLQSSWQSLAGDDHLTRRMTKFFLGMEAARTLGRMMNAGPDESYGDIAAESAGSLGRSLVEMQFINKIMGPRGTGAWRGWVKGQSAARTIASRVSPGLGNNSIVRTVGGGAGAVVRVAPSLAAAMAAERLFDVVGDIWESRKEARRSANDLRKFAASVGIDEKSLRISGASLERFNSAVRVGAFGHEFDENGNRRERGFWSRFWTLSANNAEAMRREKAWRFEEASKANQSARKAAELMDWNEAIRQTEKGKRMIVASEAFPFFWREPEKFLRALEASRVANRNWARSQSARADDRTGD